MSGWLNVRLVSEGAVVDVSSEVEQVETDVGQLRTAVSAQCRVADGTTKSASAFGETHGKDVQEARKRPANEVAGGGDVHDPLIIPVKRVRLSSTLVSVNVQPAESTTPVQWQCEEGSFPPIDTTANVVRVPSRYLKFSSVEALRRSEDLLLYKRPALLQQWKTITRDAMQRASVLSIVGAPGPGKSCAAFAFACGLVDRTIWIVVWLHFVARGDGFCCIKFHGDTKATAKWTRSFWQSKHQSEFNETLFGVPKNETRPVVVFMDGYVDEEEACVSCFCALKAWSWDNPTRRRLVSVTSMTSVSAVKTHVQIARHATQPLPDSEECRSQSQSSVMKESEDSDIYDEDREDEVLFYLTSWTLNEHYGTVKEYEFFCSVATALGVDVCDTMAQISATKRKKLVNDKYRVAGGSASDFIQRRRKICCESGFIQWRREVNSDSEFIQRRREVYCALRGAVCSSNSLQQARIQT